MVATRDFYEAIGYLTYAICNADNDVEPDELKNLGRIMLNAFGEHEMKTRGMRAYARFEMLADNNTPAENAYLQSIELFKDSKGELKEFRTLILRVLDSISLADNDREQTEIVFIQRFKVDSEAIVA